MTTFSSFYNNDNGFTKSLLETFVILTEASPVDGKEFFSRFLKGKVKIRPTKEIVELVKDSPETIDTATTFIPVSDKIDSLEDNIDKDVITLFLVNNVKRNSNGTYNISGGKLAGMFGGAYGLGDTKLTRANVIARIKKNKLPYVSVMLKNEDSGKVFEFVGTENNFNIGVKFLSTTAAESKKDIKAKSSEADVEFETLQTAEFISDSDFTDSRQESVQAVGAVVNCMPILKTLIDIIRGDTDEYGDDFVEMCKSQKFKTLIAPVIDAFSTDDASEDIAYFKKASNYNQFLLMDWIRLLSLMAGTSYFSKTISKFETTYIVHNSISKFRKLASTDESDSKVSTVDMVVSNVPAEKLLELMKTNTTKVNEDGSVIVGNGLAKFYQISLKKTVLAQLGNVKSFIVANYKASLEREQAGKELVKESLNESIISGLSNKLKVGAEKIKKLGSKIFKLVSNLVNNSLNWFKGIISRIESAANTNKKKYAVELFTGLLTEAEQSYSEIVANYEALNTNEKIKVCNKAIKKINTLLESLETKLNGIGNCGAKIEYIKSVIDVAPGTFNSLVGNYAISKTIEAMITEMDQPSKMIKGISSLLAEAVFGRSKFPIWIVYTVNDDGELPPAKLLPNKSDFIKNKIQDFETNLNENIPLFYFRARENAASNNKQYVGSYILNFYTLSNITKTDSDIEFFMTEYRCDSGDKIIIKATREMSLLDFETNLNI